jgi:hypothetical protein
MGNQVFEVSIHPKSLKYSHKAEERSHQANYCIKTAEFSV